MQILLLSIIILKIFNFNINSKKDEIENFLQKEMNAKKENSVWVMKGEINKDIEKYIILTEMDKRYKKIWKNLKFTIKVRLQEKNKTTQVKIESEIYAFGWYKYILIPPFDEKRESTGLLEEIIFQSIKDKKIPRDIIFYSISPKKGKKSGTKGEPFDSNIDLITPPDTVSQDELACAIKGSKLLAGWNDFRNPTTGYVTVGISYSHDAGANWSDNVLPALNAFNFPNQADPVVAWGKEKIAYFCFVSYNINTFKSDLGLLISQDGGKTWPTVVNVTNTPNDFDDKPWVSVYGDTVLVSYATFGIGQGVYLKKSVDGGSTFGTPYGLSTTGNGSIPKMGPNGEIYVVWGLDPTTQNPNYDEGVWLRKSVDGGNTFLPKVNVADAYDTVGILPWRTGVIPSMDVDKNTGYIYVVYNSTDYAYTHYDVYLARSIDSGASFEAPVRVNDVTTEHQFMPFVSVDENGIIHAIWYDTRTGGYNLDVYYAYSTDSGQTFSQSYKVNDTTQVPVLIGFIGDYIAIDAREYLVGTAWCHPNLAGTSDNAWFARIKKDSIPPIVNLIYPDGGETFYGNDTVTVRFNINDTRIEKILFSYSIDSGNTFTLVDSILFYDTTYKWIIPNIECSTAFFKIEVFDFAYNNSIDISDSLFKIRKVGVEEEKKDIQTLRIITLNPNITSLKGIEIFDIMGRRVTETRKMKKGIYFIKSKSKVYKIVKVF